MEFYSVTTTRCDLQRVWVLFSLLSAFSKSARSNRCLFSW